VFQPDHDPSQRAAIIDPVTAAPSQSGTVSEGARGGGDAPPSVLILTKDEDINIADCLRCFDFTDDVVVLDSYSTAHTVEIARQFPNVRVVRRRFDTWSSHSNWALRNIEFKHPWVYYSDADERVPPALRDEIMARINDPSLPYRGYRLRYRNMFLGSWIRRGGVYPVWILRLFRPEFVHYEDREVNAHPVVDGDVGELREHFVHYSFNKGLAPWFHKHNSYSQMESHEAMRVLATPLREHLRQAFSGDKTVRRRAIKNLSFYPPFRGLVRFFYMYVLRMGFLDGSAGLHYAAMISMYEYWIELKVRELKSDWRKRTDELAAKMLRDAEGKAA
jgi:glycosyltransferase involved in cell wall biosynthesis